MEQAAEVKETETKEVEVETKVDDSSTKPIETDKDIKRALDDLQKEKRLRKELEDKLKQKDLDALKASQNWQQVAELKDKEANEYRQKYEGLHSNLELERKLAAVKEEAIKLGISPNSVGDIELLPLDGVQVEYTSTGRMNVMGAQAFAQQLKMSRPNWFQAKASSINPASPGVTEPKSITLEDVKKAQAEYRKKGDSASRDKYEKVLRQFQQHGG